MQTKTGQQAEERNLSPLEYPLPTTKSFVPKLDIYIINQEIQQFTDLNFIISFAFVTQFFGKLSSAIEDVNTLIFPDPFLWNKRPSYQWM